MSDGTLKFDTKVDDTGFVEGVQKMSSKQIKLQNDIKKTQAEMSKLEKSMKEMQNTKVPTKEYQDIQKQISQAEAQLNRYLATEERMQATGSANTNSQSWKNLQYNIEQARNTINAAKADMAELQSSGGDYTVGGDVAKLEAMQSRYAALTGSLSMYEAKLIEVRNVEATASATAMAKQASSAVNQKLVVDQNQASASASRLSAMFEKVKMSCSSASTGLRKVGSVLGSVSRGFGTLLRTSGRAVTSLGRGVKSIASCMNPLNGIKNLFGGMIGRMMIMSVGFMAFTKALQGIATGFSAVVRTSPQLSASLAQIKGNLYTAFQPILTACLPALNALFSVLVKVTGALAQFISMLFGKSVKSSQAAAQAQYDQAKALDETGKSANKAKKALKGLADFDELHNTNSVDNSSNGSGGGTSDTGIAPDFTTPIETSGSVSSFVEALKKVWKESDFTEIGVIIGNKLNSALESIPWDSIQAGCNKIAKSIGTFINGFVSVKELWTTIGSTIGQGINTAIGFANTLVNTLNWGDIGDSIGLAAQSLFDTIDWDKMANTLYTGLNGVVAMTRAALSQIDFSDIGSTLATSMNKLVDGIEWKEIGYMLADGLNAAIDLLYEFVTTFDFKKLGKSLADGINGILVNTNWGKAMFDLSELALGLIDTIVSAVKNIKWKELGIAIAECITSINWGHVAKTSYEAIKAALGAIFEFFVGLGGTLFKKIASGITSGDAKKHFEGVCSGIKSAFSGISNWFKTTFTTAWNNVKKVFSSGGKVFTGIKDGILSGLKAVINALIRGINTVIAVPFDGINSALNKIKNINILGKKPFDFIGTISVPKIPALATGTVVPANYGNFLATLGDNKRAPEVVSPIPTMKQAFKEALTEMGGSGNGNPIQVQVIVGKKTIMDEVISANSDNYKAGKISFALI